MKHTDHEDVLNAKKRDESFPSNDIQIENKKKSRRKPKKAIAHPPDIVGTFFELGVLIPKSYHDLDASIKSIETKMAAITADCSEETETVSRRSSSKARSVASFDGRTSPQFPPLGQNRLDANDDNVSLASEVLFQDSVFLDFSDEENSKLNPKSYSDAAKVSMNNNRDVIGHFNNSRINSIRNNSTRNNSTRINSTRSNATELLQSDAESEIHEQNPDLSCDKLSIRFSAPDSDLSPLPLDSRLVEPNVSVDSNKSSDDSGMFSLNMTANSSVNKVPDIEEDVVDGNIVIKIDNDGINDENITKLSSGTSNTAIQPCIKSDKSSSYQSYSCILKNQNTNNKPNIEVSAAIIEEPQTNISSSPRGKSSRRRTVSMSSFSTNRKVEDWVLSANEAEPVLESSKFTNTLHINEGFVSNVRAGEDNVKGFYLELEEESEEEKCYNKKNSVLEEEQCNNVKDKCKFISKNSKKGLKMSKSYNYNNKLQNNEIKLPTVRSFADVLRCKK